MQGSVPRPTERQLTLMWQNADWCHVMWSWPDDRWIRSRDAAAVINKGSTNWSQWEHVIVCLVHAETYSTCALITGRWCTPDVFSRTRWGYFPDSSGLVPGGKLYAQPGQSSGAGCGGVSGSFCAKSEYISCSPPVQSGLVIIMTSHAQLSRLVRHPESHRILFGIKQ